MFKRSREDEMIPFPSDKRPRHYDTDLGDMPALVQETIAEFLDIREMFRLALAYEWNVPEIVQAYCRKFGNRLVRLDPGEQTVGGPLFPPGNPTTWRDAILVRGQICTTYLDLFKRCITKLEIIYSPRQQLNYNLNQYLARNYTQRLVAVVLSHWNSNHCSMDSFQVMNPFVHDVFRNVTNLEIKISSWTENEFRYLPIYFPNVTHLTLGDIIITNNNYNAFFERLEHITVRTRGYIGFVAPIWRRNAGLRTLAAHHFYLPFDAEPELFIDMIQDNPMIETLVVSLDDVPILTDEVDLFIQEHQALVKLHLRLWQIDYVMALNIMTRLEKLREFEYRVIQPHGKDDIERVMYPRGWRVTEYEQNQGIITLERVQK